MSAETIRKPTEEEQYAQHLWAAADRYEAEAWNEVVPLWHERDRLRGKWWRPFRRASVQGEWQICFNRYLIASDVARRARARCAGCGLMPPVDGLGGSRAGWRDLRTDEAVEGPALAEREA